jgi:hypothetical protein
MRTLAGFITDVRRLVQDQETLRFSDDDILGVLDLALMEVQRLRPDIVTLYSVSSASEWLMDDKVPLGPQTYSAVLSFTGGWLALGNSPSGGEDETTAAALVQRLAMSLSA